MDCNRCLLRLEDWLDGELDAATAAEVAAHLETCAECAAWLTDRKALAGELQAMEDGAAGHFRPYHPSNAIAPVRRRFRIGLAAAAALTAAGLLLVLLPRHRVPTPPEGLTAEIHVKDSLHGREDSFITGREQGRRFRIHVQVVVTNNGHPG